MGCYHVWLFDIWLASWRRLVIDDFVPMALDATGHILAPWAGGHGRTLWAGLLEKALAKLCGSYEALTASEPGPIIMALCGQCAADVSQWKRDGAWCRAGTSCHPMAGRHHQLASTTG